jgi:tripartite motif-containing protein 71
MKRFVIASLFIGMSLIALVIGISCSSQTPNAALVAPVQTISANNPTYTSTCTNTPTQTATPTPQFPVTGFNGPYALAIDSKNNVYVGDTGNNLVKQYVNGFQSSWPSGKAKSASGLAYTSPKAIAADSLGNIYVVGSGSTVSKYDANGNLVTTYAASLSATLSGVVVNSAGTTLYVSDAGNSQIVSIALPAGGLNSGFGTSGKLTTTYVPYGLAIDTAGNLYVAGTDNNVHIYTSTGANGSPVSTVPGFNKPYAVALDASNNLYVSDSGNGQVEEFNVSGLTGSPNNIIGKGTLSIPEGIALDSSANVYVVDSGNGSLFQFP